jgi:predicted nucleic acid-binding protein
MTIEISRRNLISFWDALIIESAVKLKCDVVFSEDLNPGQTYEGVKIVNPFAT